MGFRGINEKLQGYKSKRRLCDKRVIDRTVELSLKEKKHRLKEKANCEAYMLNNNRESQKVTQSERNILKNTSERKAITNTYNTDVKADPSYIGCVDVLDGSNPYVYMILKI